MLGRLSWGAIIVAMTASTTTNINYPAEMGDKHLEDQIAQLEKYLGGKIDNVENSVRDLSQKIDQAISKEVFQSEVRRIDDNRDNDLRYNAGKFKELADMIAGIKGFTWKAVTLAVGIVGLMLTTVNVLSSIFL